MLAGLISRRTFGSLRGFESHPRHHRQTNSDSSGLTGFDTGPTDRRLRPELPRLSKRGTQRDADNDVLALAAEGSPVEIIDEDQFVCLLAGTI